MLESQGDSSGSDGESQSGSSESKDEMEEDINKHSIEVLEEIDIGQAHRDHMQYGRM